MTLKYKLHPFFEENAPPKRLCDHEGCELFGEFKAPRNRANLRDYYWFCLEHVRAYNGQWNYYVGMDEKDVENERRFDATWQRPTWPFAKAALQGKPIQNVQDVFDLLRSQINSEAMNAKPSWFAPETEEAKAILMFELTYPFTKKDLKIRYIELAKKYHPDANGGSREAEDRLKAVNLAYEVLKKIINF